MNSIKKRIIVASVSSLAACASIVTPLTIGATNVIKAAQDAASSKTTFVYFTTADPKVTITGKTKIKVKVGSQFCNIEQPVARHQNNWKFKGWYKDGTEITKNFPIPSEGLTATPLFEEPINITNCMGVSAIEGAKITFNFQENNAPNVQVSTDFGQTWNDVKSYENGIDVTAGSSAYFRGDNTDHFSTGSDNYTHITFSKLKDQTEEPKVNLYGNVLALIYNGQTVTKTSPIPQTNGSYCFYHLFEGCTQIMNVDDNFLPSEGEGDVNNVLKPNCYEGMFKGCTNIEHAPRLFATNKAVEGDSTAGYSAATDCYKEIFYGCSKVDYIRTRYTNKFSETYFKDWVYGVASSGLLIYDGDDTSTGTSAIPSGWNVSVTPDKVSIAPKESSVKDGIVADHAYEFTATCWKDGSTKPVLEQSVFWISMSPSVATIDQNSGKLTAAPFTSKEASSKTVVIVAYPKTNLNISATYKVTIYPVDLTKCTQMTATEDSTFTYKYTGTGTAPSFRYSNDNGATWRDVVKDTAISIAANNSIYIKGDNPNGLTPGKDALSYANFAITGKVNISGDIKSLIFDARTDIADDVAVPCDYCFMSLFEGASIGTVSQKYLSFKTLKPYCYYYMFANSTLVTNSTNTIELPAETMCDYCYADMFLGCSNVTVAPELSSTALATGCYAQMFYGSKITASPALPATILKPKCYYMMFQSCSTITSIGFIGDPTFTTQSTITDAKYCFFQMFANCGFHNKVASSTSSSTNCFMWTPDFAYNSTSHETTPEMCVYYMFHDDNHTAYWVEPNLYYTLNL